MGWQIFSEFLSQFLFSFFHIFFTFHNDCHEFYQIFFKIFNDFDIFVNLSYRNVHFVFKFIFNNLTKHEILRVQIYEIIFIFQRNGLERTASCFESNFWCCIMKPLWHDTNYVTLEEINWIILNVCSLYIVSRSVVHMIQPPSGTELSLNNQLKLNTKNQWNIVQH